MFLIEKLQDGAVKKYMNTYTILENFVSSILESIRLDCNNIHQIQIDKYASEISDVGKSKEDAPLEIFTKFTIIGERCKYHSGTMKFKVRERKIDFEEIHESELYAETIGDVEIELNTFNDYPVKIQISLNDNQYFRFPYSKHLDLELHTSTAK